MSTNCIRCVVNKRTGPDLLCDSCRPLPVETGGDIIGGFPMASPNCCGCGKPLTIENAWMTDGCPCNSKLGVNSMNETRWRLLMELQQRQARELESHV